MTGFDAVIGSLYVTTKIMYSLRHSCSSDSPPCGLADQTSNFVVASLVDSGQWPGSVKYAVLVGRGRGEMLASNDVEFGSQHSVKGVFYFDERVHRRQRWLPLHFAACCPGAVVFSRTVAVVSLRHFVQHLFCRP
jgi:hypothetical protein